MVSTEFALHLKIVFSSFARLSFSFENLDYTPRLISNLHYRAPLMLRLFSAFRPSEPHVPHSVRIAQEKFKENLPLVTYLRVPGNTFCDIFEENSAKSVCEVNF